MGPPIIPNKQDFACLKYPNNWGFFKERLNDEGLCSICKKKTSRTHVTNSCPEFNLLREKTRTDVLNITELRKVADLEKALLSMYHQPSAGQVRRLIRWKRWTETLITTSPYF